MYSEKTIYKTIEFMIRNKAIKENIRYSLQRIEKIIDTIKNNIVMLSKIRSMISIFFILISPYLNFKINLL